MSTLYVRKGATSSPSSRRTQVAGFQAYGKVRDEVGSDEVKAMEALAQTQKGDPLAAGLQAMPPRARSRLSTRRARSRGPFTKRTHERWRRPSPGSSWRSCEAIHGLSTPNNSGAQPRGASPRVSTGSAESKEHTQIGSDRRGVSSQFSNHALANSQSRLTVAMEMPRTSAVSVSIKPPKNRSSTTRLALGSAAARCVSA